MFLVFYTSPKHIIEYVLQFIEENSVLVGVITSVITSSLWLRKFLKQKRAEAFFGFYSKLSLCLNYLQATLEEDGQLNISSFESGNIYSLIYLNDYISTVCPTYKVPTEKDIEKYLSAAKALKELLLETENNVYPPRANRDKWYESQHVLFLFCNFIENKAFWHKINTTDDKCTEPKHILKCKELVNAMDYIQESIKKAKY